ncbi:RND family efflux transporter MFP subunit [Desulfohalotomaculum tongense]|uniref:efflux RND transporter periplasmic adaptor subunit n=1 Tax=Desulforadius tongensis TaxID=1216062 RepID=UPI001958FD63|nr:efflux RND transporter periplasmic adaptor subunit [Desulforadius tongensis]MBM7856145.1 RND family efflux transporter MFP subunit [Desulforadius tongensis]
MKSKYKLWLIPVAAILVLGLFKGAIWSSSKPQQQPGHVHTVMTAEAVMVDKENTLVLTGSIEARNEAVISAKLSGKVSKVMVENGDLVQAGQPLVLLENTEYKNGLTNARAVLKKAEANLHSTRLNYERIEQLYREGAVAQKDFDDIQTALKVAEADVEAAAAGVANAQESLNNTTVTSPINGVVANRDVTTGEVINAGKPLMMVEDISSVYAVVNIEQKYLADIKPGLPAEVTVDAYGDRKFKGQVAVINPSVNKSARVFETKIKVENKDHLLRPGMFAQVVLKIGKPEKVLAVPREALTGKQGLYFVFVAEGDKVKRQPVEIGQLIGKFVEIKSGLVEGQQVVVTNVNKLKDRDKINITPRQED